MKHVISAVAGLSVSLAAHAEDAASSAPEPVDLSKPTLYVVGYAHLDTQWRWGYPETIRDFLAHTLHRNFDLIDKHPGYIFNFSGSRRYELMKEYHPAEYERLKQYIKDGRWFPCGSSVDENDANVPSGESLVRQVLYGNLYFRREFGVASEEFMLPDCFGFPAALPQVLAHCGLKGFSTQKLTWNSCVPIPFKVGVWEGPDGSRLVSALDPGAYVGEVREDLSNSNGWLARINATGQKSGVFVDYHYYGTGDQGGSPKPESVAMVEKSRTGSGPIRVLHARADDMFKDISPEMAARLPTYKGELQLTEHSAGSITSQAYMKRWNRKNELLADAAERAAVAAMWLGARPYPTEKLEDAWYLVLGSQMHDILPGTSIPKAYEYSWNDEVLAANLFAQILQDSAAAVIADMDTTGPGVAIVVYNPTSADRDDVTEATIERAGDAPKHVTVIGPGGKAVPAQVLDARGGKARIAFVASVPQVGFAVYHASFGDASATIPSLRVSERMLENEFYRVGLNDDGDVASIFDKRAGREMLSGPARLGLHEENPSAWPAWNQDWDDRVKPARGYVSGPAKFEIVENGPARVAVKVTRTTGGSTFIQTISLSAGSGGERVEFDNDILWNTRERSLRAAFPLTVTNPIATYDIQAGAIERPNSHKQQFEYCFHQWFDLSTPEDGKLGVPYGVAVMCDSKYGADKPDDSTVRLTLLHTPGTRGGYQDQGTQDLGRHRVKFALQGHAGTWRDANTPLQAARLNQPLIPFVASSHAGGLGKTFSLLKISDPTVSIAAIKKAEVSNEVVVRLREHPGRGTKAVKLTMNSPIAAAREVDGQERPIASATTAGGALVTDIHGFGLRAFALQPGTPPTPPRSVSVANRLSLPFDTDVISTNSARGDGDFDGRGATFPAEQFPSRFSAEGTPFEFGPTSDGARNAVTCRGQEIALPAGTGRVYLLAAATEDVASTISIGGVQRAWAVQAWNGYIGQWDNRLWKGDIPDSAYNWANEVGGLVPGYIKSDPVAWFSTHHHTPKGDAYYEFCYLFKHAIDVKPGAKSITLPNEPRIKVLAATAAAPAAYHAEPAAPLFDELRNAGESSEPSIVVPDGPDHDSKPVRIEPGLYWRAGAFRYTLDGTDPTPDSPAYATPIWVSSPVTMKAGQVNGSGSMGRIVEARLNISDRTPPRITRISGAAMSSKVLIEFSEPVEAATSSTFTLQPGGEAASVTFAADHRSAVLTFAASLGTNARHTLTASAIRDRSPARNEMKDARAEFTSAGPVYTLNKIDRMGVVAKDVPGLPCKAGDAWTLNMWVKAAKQPRNRTVFAGFGACATGRTGGARYITKFANGVHFWSDNQDVDAQAPLALSRWQMLTATYDGVTLRLYQDAKKIGEEQISLIDDQNIVNVGPKDPWDRRYQFEGELANLSIWNAALDEAGLAVLHASKPE